ncbi:MAG: hypothetical protein ACFFC7_18120 [Candidatus Hermodarchaeota archaeon]
MSANFDEILQKVYQYSKPIAFGLVILGTLLVDLTIGAILPFWITPLTLGIIAGILIGSAQAGLYAILGAMLGRLVSIFVMIIAIPGLLETLELFISAIGDFIGVTLPGGSLIIILLSILINGIFAALGGTTGGAIVQLVKSYTAYKQETTAN